MIKVVYLINGLVVTFSKLATLQKKNKLRSSFMAQRVKDLTLSLHQLESLLQCGFDPWPRNFHML